MPPKASRKDPADYIGYILCVCFLYLNVENRGGEVGSDNDTHVGVIFLTHRGHQSSISGFPPTGLCLSDTACTSL